VQLWLKLHWALAASAIVNKNNTMARILNKKGAQICHFYKIKTKAPLIDPAFIRFCSGIGMQVKIVCKSKVLGKARIMGWKTGPGTYFDYYYDCVEKDGVIISKDNEFIDGTPELFRLLQVLDGSLEPMQQ